MRDWQQDGELFLRRGIARVFEFLENHVLKDDGVPDPEWLVPAGAEVFWTSRELDWVLYVSHEHSITVAGDWLVAGVKAIWPNRQERLYTDYRYAAQLGQHLLATSPWFRRPSLQSP